MMRALLLVLLVAALAGCSAPPTPSAAGVEPATSPAPVESEGMRLRIPDLDIDAAMAELHRDSDGVLVPPPVNHPEVIGWYADGVEPGDSGPALIAGHVSGRPDGVERSVPGSFSRLSELTAGDRVNVIRNGAELAFEVYGSGTFSKAQFPTSDVYGDTVGPELRLVTCGGVFDPQAHSYVSNVVVFARLVR